MKQKFIFKHQFKLKPRLIDESTQTLPDLVLSMAEIYRKYAVTGDIASLPGAVRPLVQDPEDYDGEAPDYEELVDIGYHRTQMREELRTRQQDSGHPAAEDKSVGSQEPSDKKSQTSAIQEVSDANPADFSSE